MDSTFKLFGNFDLEELKNHLFCNGYKTVFSGTVLYVPDEEFYEVQTILNDREIEYEIY